MNGTNVASGSALNGAHHPSPTTAHTTNGHLSPPPQPVPLSQKAQGKARQLDAPLPSLPSSGVFIPPSRLFSSPSPPPTGDDQQSGQIPLDALKSELNNEDDGLIPLAAIIERVASEAYETLQNLGET